MIDILSSDKNNDPYPLAVVHTVEVQSHCVDYEVNEVYSINQMLYTKNSDFVYNIAACPTFQLSFIDSTSLF